jgi:hypothetical protein
MANPAQYWRRVVLLRQVLIGRCHLDVNTCGGPPLITGDCGNVSLRADSLSKTSDRCGAKDTGGFAPAHLPDAMSKAARSRLTSMAVGENGNIRRDGVLRHRASNSLSQTPIPRSCLREYRTRVGICPGAARTTGNPPAWRHWISLWIEEAHACDQWALPRSPRVAASFTSRTERWDFDVTPSIIWYGLRCAHCPPLVVRTPPIPGGRGRVLSLDGIIWLNPQPPRSLRPCSR